MAAKFQVFVVDGYPGFFYLDFETGDVRSRLVLTRPVMEALRAEIVDALAADDIRRRDSPYRQ